ncbi:MAG: hypothetical protein IKV90_05065, partial [Clostridia bacterium]|nr:hypothetical protein [Clostridia bacterium]
MDQREQMNQQEPAQEAQREPRQRTQASRNQDGTIRVNSLMSALRSLDRVEEKLTNSSRVPFKNNLSMVNVNDVLDLLSQVRSELPAALQEAVEVLGNKQQIEETAAQRAQEKINNANTYAQDTIRNADEKAKQTVENAQQHALEMEQQARATAEKILIQANADAQLRTEESEIVRRANARAKEIYDQVQMDV